MNSPPEKGAAGKRPKRRKEQNPIEAALLAWWETLPLRYREQHEHEHEHDRDQLVAQAPKRWTVYEPMALLPTGAFGSAAWRAILDGCSEEEQDEHTNRLWRGILSEISKKQGQKAPPLTHLAVNEGIPLHHHSDPTVEVGGARDANNNDNNDNSNSNINSNILRSPSGLRMLYGDFGPSSTTLLASDGGPSAADFAAAFWVSTRQNGIFQTWAPRWTMFSRGNVKEKARLLDFHTSSSSSSSSSQREVLATRMQRAYAVDLYAGIGYFVFSYARLGMRVLCWELNPWSVEGLRRGAVGNGWGVRVVRGEELLSAASMDEILAGGEQIIVFLEDNARAAGRIAGLQRRSSGGGGDGSGGGGGEIPPSLDVLHVNCGLLPASDASWEGAWDIVGDSEQSWLHLHENVGVADIEKRKGEIERWFGKLAERDGGRKAVYVDHVEQVKTFAPGVWHCVFDLYISRSSNIT